MAATRKCPTCGAFIDIGGCPKHPIVFTGYCKGCGYPMPGKHWSGGCEEALAAAFAAKIREELTPEEVAEVDRLNKERDDSSCATHDFCDANMPMADAFKIVYGREVDPRKDADCDLWNAAWSTAKKAGFAAKGVPS